MQMSEPGPVGGRYEIRVAGLLSDGVREAFEGMRVQQRPPETVIMGPVVDESHLYGLLALIQDLGLHVVSIQEVPE